MIIIKHYQCPVYKTIKMKIFNVAADCSIKDESAIFSSDQLDKMLNLYRVKRYIPIECGKAKHIETLQNDVRNS